MAPHGVRAWGAKKVGLLFCCLAGLLLRPAGAYYVDFNGTVTPFVYTMPSAPLQYTLDIALLKLGVDAGGQVSLDIKLRPKDTVAIVSLYTYVQIVNVLQSTSFKHPNYPSYGRAELAGDSTVTFQVPVRNRYYVVIYAPSNAGELSYSGRATIMNPHPFSWRSNGGDSGAMTHLAVEDYYMPLTTYLSTAMFVLLAAVWVWRFRKSRTRRYPIQHMYLPRLITLVIVAHLVSALLSTVYYFYYEADGNPRSDILFAQSLADVVANTLFLSLILLTAMGYTISRVFLTGRERQLLALAFATLSLFSALRAGCPNASNDDLCMSFFLGVQVVKFLITFSVILQLHNQIDLVRDACQAQHATRKADLLLVLAGYRKLQRLEAFRWIVLSYLALPVAFLFSSFSLLSWADEIWLPKVAENVCIWAVLLSLGWAASPGSRCLLDGAPIPTSTSEADILGAGFPAPADSNAPAAETAPRGGDAPSSGGLAGAAGLASPSRSPTAVPIPRAPADEDHEVELTGYETPPRGAGSSSSDEDWEEGDGGEGGRLRKLRSSPSLKGQMV